MARKRKGGSGTTVHAHEGVTPKKAQVKRSELIARTESLVVRRVGQFMKEHDKDVLWATGARAYYVCLIRGVSLSGRVKLDEETRKNVRTWVAEACEKTGLQPSTSATKKKRG